MTTKALLAGVPLGVLATGMIAGTAHAAAPGTTTQTFNYDLGLPFVSDGGLDSPIYDVTIGASASPQYSYQYGYDPTTNLATPKLATQGNALINPEIFHNGALPSNNEDFQSFDPVFTKGTPTGPSVQGLTAKDLSAPQGTSGLFTSAAVASDNYLHLKFDIGDTTYLGSAHFSGDGQELYDITYAAADGVPAVPEPAVWAELVLGFGAIGGLARTQRRRRQRDVALAA